MKDVSPLDTQTDMQTDGQMDRRIDMQTVGKETAKEIDALYAELQSEAAALDTIHEMLGSGRWTMDFDEAGVMTQVKWSDEFRRMIGYNSTDVQ